MTMTAGVVYIAFGKKYREEASVSMASVRRESPTLKIAVVTDRSWDEAFQPDEVLVRERVDGWRCKPLYVRESPFDRSLFLDTDTLVVRDITPVFKLLDYFDVGVNFGGSQLKQGDLEVHGQCNSGVILFKQAPVVNEMFDLWLGEYEAAQAACLRNQPSDTRGVGDQRYLAIAIARSRARPVHLPIHLNFFIHDYAVLYTPPAIIHGRIPGMAGLVEQLGIGTSWRAEVAYEAQVWMPNVRGLIPNGLRRSDPFMAMSILLRRCVNEVRRRWYARSMPSVDLRVHEDRRGGKGGA